MRIRGACLTLLMFVAAVPTALAGPPGKWSQLGQANLRNIDQAALARTSDGTLHVVWTIPGTNNDALVHDAVGPNGVVAPPNVITSGWATINPVPDLLSTGDTLRVLFGGIRTTNSDEPNQNMNTATASASGATWDLFVGTVVKGDSAYAGDTGATLLPDGTPLISWGGTGAGVLTHRGLDPNTPNFGFQAQLGGCCGYSPDVAVDTKTGTPFITWYSNAGGNGLGVFAQALDPATGGPSGPASKMPGSTTTFNGSEESSQMLQRTPIAARAGGGVYVVYPGGYPTTKLVRFWRLPNTTSAVVASGPAGKRASLAAAPDGRMWVLWSEQTSPPQIFARRSNKAATKFGPAVKIKAPPGADSIFKIDGNAQAGPLDVVVLGGAANLAQWHTQILPALDIAGSPKKKGGATTFTVTDPEPVSGVKITAGGKSGTTNGTGKVTLTLKGTKAKSLKVTAKKTGYTTASERLKTK